ncbi:unnamed protein product [Arabis nemorensis]|uniref:Uncharacterized protein n=1 Tax=Arabis nemorensis TaxID=586526 RepID=A0A565AWC4_9BRAS|nr:unnamed protein product [Arabis nemorensis]
MPDTLPRKCVTNPKETCNVTFSEDEICEESMEWSLQEEESDDAMDVYEILSTEKNEEIQPEGSALTDKKINFEEAFHVVHKMMNELLVPLQRRAVSPRDTVTLTNVDTRVTYDITTTPSAKKKVKAATYDYGDPLTGSTQDKGKGSVGKRKGNPPARDTSSS